MDYMNQNEPQQDTTYHYTGREVDAWAHWEDKPQKQKKKSKGWTAGRIIALTLCASLISGALGAGGAVAFHLLTKEDPVVVQSQQDVPGSTMLVGDRDSTMIDIQKIDTSRIMTPAEVYALNVGSTVGITTAVTTNYWGYQTTSAAAGSGFILSADGYILTNFHVIENSSSITVACYDGTEYEAALIGYDESNDIAVLKVDATDLTPVVLGSSDDMNVGDSVVAIGNPLGELTFSLTAGTVSALNRQVTMSTGTTMTLIQTDCAINSGNSGGALFNLYGEVVGITNAKYSSSASSGASIDNIGFAIPMDDVRGIVESIIEKGYVAKPYIGVSVTDVSTESQSYGAPEGAAVRSVSQDSPAEKAGLQTADIITQVNGVAITSSADLVNTVAEAQAGDVLQLQIYRQGEYLQFSVTVGEQIQSTQPSQQGQQQYQPNPFGGYGR